MNRSGQNNTTGTNVIVTEVSNMPLVDAHMHIQSNDIAPLPIMFGVLNFNISRKIYELPVINNRELEKKMNFVNLSYIEEKGRELNLRDVSPANRGGLVVQDFANSKMEIDAEKAINETNFITSAAFNILRARLVLRRIPLVKIINTLAQYVLRANTDGQRRALIDITGRFFPYGKITRHSSFFIAGIYKNNALERSMMVSYASRILSGGQVDPGDVAEGINERKVLVAEREDRGKGAFSVVSRHYYGNRFFNIGFLFKKSVVLGMELMYAHYWGVYGIPMYIPGDNGKYYIITNNIKNNSESIFCAYDIPGNIVQNIIRGNAVNAGSAPVINNARLGISEKYCHFLKQIPATEMEQYEDLRKYNNYVMAATVKWPLQYFPFFHLDPRRFFAPSSRISKYHDFYCCDAGEIRKMPTEWINEKLNSRRHWRYGMDVERDLKPQLLRKERGAWKEGLFWGIKMYAALGFAPYLFDTQKAKEAFHCLEEGDYRELLDFYNYCAESEIPITCHGSPQGMTIADPGVYLKEFLKDKQSGYRRISSVNFPLDGKTFMNGIGLIDSFSSPYSWELVLNRLAGGNKNKFTLCLAHFGGQDYFNGKFEAAKDNDTPYRWLDTIVKLIRENDGVYVDLSCFTYKEFINFPAFISQRLYNAVQARVGDIIGSVYPRKTGIRYYLNNGLLENNVNSEMLLRISRLRIELIKMCNEYNELSCYRELNKTSETIKNLIKAKGNQTLQHRIMFGTDWPMTETKKEVKGVSIYNSAMFVLLQMVTEYCGNEWDAWHQFAVINPLRFLGLLDVPAYSKEERESYRVNFEKIDTMKKAIEKYIDANVRTSEVFDDYYLMTEDSCRGELRARYQELEELYRDKNIPAAHKMKYGNDLLLTSGGQARGNRR
jgi:hypothetical protein